ncbi:hypothetical protein Glove_168g45 [Diversispora epigaea]|uniref:Attractin/MKLN-like beta-propeller domain-containing protein n=1 Tax=Diversispora epigaea TaxID=1348612 RepID=A0A397IYI4_9GLOM|nr:hypothetical protein Glove_168g45 [Diversispora epigaea]
MYLPFKLFKSIFYTLLLINSILCYIPPKRFLHNSVIINDKLLILGGYTNTTDYEFEIFYLDLSKSFDNFNLTWTLIQDKGLPVYVWRSTSVLSLDNSTVYLIGGFMINKETNEYDYSNLVYTYDYSTSKWSTRQNIKGVIDDSGNIYIFGGFNATNLTSLSGKMFNDMNVLNFLNTWTTLSISKNLPLPCMEYTANIFPNGTIIYIGGLEQVGAFFTLVGMKKIKLFDTHKHEWSQMNATGDKIDPRMYFSSVLTPDGYIIIFGGCSYSNGSIISVGVSPKFATLDTNKNPFVWSSNSEVGAPSSIYGHTANLYNDYMIITFGIELDTNKHSSQVYFYNIKSNRWVITFSPPDNETTTTTTLPATIATTPSVTTTPSETTTTTTPSPAEKSKSLVIGLGIGIALSLISCISIAIFIVRRIRKRSVILQMPGNIG